AYLDENHPDRILLCEANQWPQDVRPYFGDGDEFQMGFHFPLMPRIFMALRRGERAPLQWILDRTPEIPSNCQWCIFLRNHDELTLEMVTEDERQWMWEQYAPEPRMRLNLGIRRRLSPLLDNNHQKIVLANSLLFTMPGSPIIYYGDEIGMGDNIWLFDRNGVRTPMQWSAGRNAGFSSAAPEDLYAPVIADEHYNPLKINVAQARSDPGSIWQQLKHFIAIRKQHKSFGWGNFEWIEFVNPGIAAYIRTYQDEQIIVINNLTVEDQSINLKQINSDEVYEDLITGDKFTLSPEGNLRLDIPPYGYLWLLVH
ncbi:MAG: alpha-glucosidase C-terminal domain-containing protein, partial [Anaerolineales bacterium]